MSDQEYLYATYLSEEFIFVFGSNLKGIHGSGAARYALEYRGANLSVPEGVIGGCYAIPTKKSPYENMSLDEIKIHVDRFIDYAHSHPDKLFQVTRIGTGRAGFKDSDIAPLFKNAPKNCYIPGVWLKQRNKNLYRIIVAGSRTITDKKYVFNKLDDIILKLPHDADIEIISGLARGVDTLAVEYCADRNLRCIGFPAEWDIYKKRAGYLRNYFMSWYATHAIIFWDGDSRGTKSMIDIADESLTYKVLHYKQEE